MPARRIVPLVLVAVLGSAGCGGGGSGGASEVEDALRGDATASSAAGQYSADMSKLNCESAGGDSYDCAAPVNEVSGVLWRGVRLKDGELTNTEPEPVATGDN